MLLPSTRLQHQGDSECLQQRRNGVITRVSLALRGGTGKGHSESWHDRDIVVRSEKETEEIENCFMSRTAGKKQPHTSLEPSPGKKVLGAVVRRKSKSYSGSETT